MKSEGSNQSAATWHDQGAGSNRGVPVGSGSCAQWHSLCGQAQVLRWGRSGGRTMAPWLRIPETQALTQAQTLSRGRRRGRVRPGADARRPCTRPPPETLQQTRRLAAGHLILGRRRAARAGIQHGGPGPAITLPNRVRHIMISTARRTSARTLHARQPGVYVRWARRLGVPGDLHARFKFKCLSPEPRGPGTQRRRVGMKVGGGGGASSPRSRALAS